MKNLFFFSLLFVSIQAFAKPDTDNSFDCLVFHQLDAETKVNCLKELHCVMKPNGKLIIANRGKAQNKWMRFTFLTVQLLDGFKTTNDNVKGLMPDFIAKAGFVNVIVSKSINIAIGTFSYFKANKK
jgi:ubiquinone/menaquinone biosynthesis C-methylase UbiE